MQYEYNRFITEDNAEREYLIEQIAEMLEEISNLRKIRLIYEYVENIAR